MTGNSLEAFEARLQKALVAFRAIPPKPPKPRSKRKQIVAALFDEITRLKQGGYSFEEIAAVVLENTKVEMTPGTLHNYWNAERQERKKKKRQLPKRSKAASQERSKSAQQSPTESTPDLNEPRPEPKGVKPDLKLVTAEVQTSSAFTGTRPFGLVES